MSRQTIEEFQEKVGFDMQVDLQLAIVDVMARHVANATKAQFTAGDVAFCIGSAAMSALFESSRTDHGVTRVLTDEEKDLMRGCFEAMGAGYEAQIAAIGSTDENIQNGSTQ